MPRFSSFRPSPASCVASHPDRRLLPPAPPAIVRPVPAGVGHSPGDVPTPSVARARCCRSPPPSPHPPSLDGLAGPVLGLHAPPAVHCGSPDMRTARRAGRLRISPPQPAPPPSALPGRGPSGAPTGVACPDPSLSTPAAPHRPGRSSPSAPAPAPQATAPPPAPRWPRRSRRRLPALPPTRDCARPHGPAHPTGPPRRRADRTDARALPSRSHAVPCGASRHSLVFADSSPITPRALLRALLPDQGAFPPAPFHGLAGTTPLCATPTDRLRSSRRRRWPGPLPTTDRGFPCGPPSLVHACCRHDPGGIRRVLVSFASPPDGGLLPVPVGAACAFAVVGACSAFTARDGLQARRVPCGLSNASTASLPPQPLRWLPAGTTLAGREFHPLRGCAFARHTGSPALPEGHSSQLYCHGKRS